MLLIRIESKVNKMKITQDERDFLRKFFNDNLSWIREKEIVDPSDIKLLADLYSEYLNNSSFCDSDVLKVFLLDLKKSQYFETKVKMEQVNLSPKERLYRMSEPASSGGLFKCKNHTIGKWYQVSRVIRVITQADINRINRAIEPKIKQNKLERVKSWEASKDIWVGK